VIDSGGRARNSGGRKLGCIARVKSSVVQIHVPGGRDRTIHAATSRAAATDCKKQLLLSTETAVSTASHGAVVGKARC
jgi:hypothetical protein